MLNEVQIDRMIGKIKRFETMVSTMLFEKVASLDMSSYQTKKQLYDIPDKSLMEPIEPGDKWGGDEYTYCWFTGEYIVHEDLVGKPLFVRPQVGGYEALLWVDGKPFGTFATKIVVTGHGNHYCDMIMQNPEAGQKIDLAIEFYTGHHVEGTQPFESNALSNFDFIYDSVDICTKNQLVSDFYFDLKTINELYDILPDTSYRKAELVNVMQDLHKTLYYSPGNVDRETFMASLIEGRSIMADALSKHNSPSAPFVGVIGHSHMDTAWLWHIDETIKKCARTFSNQLNLMDQYPEYKFVQSSAYHGDMIREHYPELFERIKDKVKEGRFEPNGGVWVECDCNITSGESMIRQFLWGQRFTRDHFGYTSNSFWLPDTFGYSASIPQIMKGCGVDYFLTTKIAWNDTNLFPYDTFWWKGIDGTRVFSHFNKTHIWPSPKDVAPIVYDSKNNDGVKQKHVTDRKLVSYGFGDGGGGPQFEMIEMARRSKDLEGSPKMEHVLVGEFMEELQKTAKNPSVYNGELYLELHRGTLTNQHEIKRNNRLAEINIHNLEYLVVQKAVEEGKNARDNEYRDLQNTVLINQFHDILPGTSIPRVHEEARGAVGGVIQKSNSLIMEELEDNTEDMAITVVNTTSFKRDDVIYLDFKEGYRLAGGYRQQVVENIKGEKKLAVGGVTIEPYASVVLSWEAGEINDHTRFSVDNNKLETPFAKVSFDDKMYIESFIDKSINRELCGEGYPLNTFITAEDVPTAWDSWDIDADIQLKMRDHSKLISTRVISEGPVELRIRNKYGITDKSFIDQDMIFYAHSPLVKFETMMDWKDDHRFLKTAFDTSIFSDIVRQEIQFGYLKRPTTRNNSIDQAKFEVLNHKYTDLSENKYGVAILNDSKYAISANEGQLRLSLHKGGVRPDFYGDKGEHYCEYGFLPHNSGFTTDSVIKPAYEFNYKHLVARSAKNFDSLISTSESNIVVETIKPCEDAENAFIVRLYDAEGTYTTTDISLAFYPKSVEIANMLEEVQEELISNKTFSLTFKPFEIKTVKVCY